MSDTNPPPPATPTPPTTSAATGNRRYAVAGAVAALVVVAAAIVVLATRSDDETAADGACIADLMARLPGDTAFAQGSDLVAARDRGYDDSSTEALVDSTVEVGVHPDPLSRRVLLQQFELDADAMPFDPADVECWVGDLGDFVARGSFDHDRVRSARYGEGLHVAADGGFVATDRVLLSSPTGDATGPEGLVDAFDVLDRDGVLSFAFMTGRVDGEADRSWIGIGLVPEGSSAWGLSAVWAFGDDATAQAGEPRLREILAETSAVGQLVAGDPAEALERDGAVLWLRDRLDVAPHQWMALMQRLDAAFAFDPHAESGE